ncbi:MAG: RNA polymerase sigma factor [Thermaurantiacus sp.]
MSVEADRWLVAVSQGDRQALRHLYDALAMKLLGVAMRILGDRYDAEDVVQDVFVTIWRKADSFQPGRASAEAWLVAITRNRAIDRLRQRGRRPSAPESLLEFHADPDARADRGAEVADANQTVSRALASLDPRHAAVIRAAWLEGLSYDELSAREGVPVGTIKTWVFRGLRRMREGLQA